MALTEEQRKKIAADAVWDAEVKAALSTLKIEDTRGPKIGASLEANRYFVGAFEVHVFIAKLIVERDDWKRRAGQHGCDVENGDPDCG